VSSGTKNGAFTTSDSSTAGVTWKVPSSGGPYEFRYFYNNGYTILGKSGSMTVTTVAASPTTAPTRLPTRAPTPTLVPARTPSSAPLRPTSKPTSSSIYPGLSVVLMILEF